MRPDDIEEYKIYIENNKYFYYLLPFDKISAYVKNWSRNRICDSQKVIEMYNTYVETKHLHFFLHLAFDKEEKMICYDGNHRFHVLEKLLEHDKINHNVFISVLWEATYDDIFNDFQNLNKQITIPEMFIVKAKYSDELINDVQSMVNNYSNKYKAFTKISNYPKAPHFSINLFQDEIINIYEKLPKEKKDLTVIQDALNLYNKYMESIAVPGTKLYDKCFKASFWLFYKKPLDVDIILSYC
jgi:hypothetical protein